MRDILDTVNRWLREERPVALATVAKTWGSAPRREGSKMGIAGDRRHDWLGQRRLRGRRGH